MTVSLSQLTKNMTDVPIVDTDAWVRRPVEDRKKETEQKGKILRPMNSFMLYRRAYTERIKRCSSRGSPQVVSSIAGKSWHMEPQQVHDEYQRLAQIERDGHAEAYPGYKLKLNLRKKPHVAEPVAPLESLDVFERSDCGRPPIQGFETSIQSPVNFPCSGYRPKTSTESFIAPMGDFSSVDYSSGSVEDLHEAHYDLLCPEPNNHLTDIFFDEDYADFQWQASLWPIF